MIDTLRTSLARVAGFALVASALGLQAQAAVPESVAQACTTTPRIYNETAIPGPAGLDRLAKRQAVLDGLGYSTSNPDPVTSTFIGQWFFENETDDAIFAGYKIRTHYLRTAVIYTDTGFTTIICDSNNLNQSARSIHRKAPLWKDTLNGNLRIELGRLGVANTPTAQIQRSLDFLREQNIITAAEHREFSARAAR